MEQVCEGNRMSDPGLNPWPSAYTDWNGKVMKIWEAKVLDENTDATPGTIVKVEKDGFSVQTQETDF